MLLGVKGGVEMAILFIAALEEDIKPDWDLPEVLGQLFSNLRD